MIKTYLWTMELLNNHQYSLFSNIIYLWVTNHEGPGWWFTLPKWSATLVMWLCLYRSKPVPEQLFVPSQHALSCWGSRCHRGQLGRRRCWGRSTWMSGGDQCYTTVSGLNVLADQCINEYTAHFDPENCDLYGVHTHSKDIHHLKNSLLYSCKIIMKEV